MTQLMALTGRTKVLAAIFGLVLGQDVAGVDVGDVQTLSAAIVGAAYILAEAWVDCRRQGETGTSPAPPAAPAMGFDVPTTYEVYGPEARR